MLKSLPQLQTATITGFEFGVSAPSPCSDDYKNICNVERGEGWDEVMEEAFRYLTVVTNCYNQDIYKF